MDNNNIDIMIKKSLSGKAGEIIPEDKFSSIKTKVENSPNQSNLAMKYRLQLFNFKRSAAALLCALFIIAGLSFAFSEDVRAVAADTINKIKSIFVVDKVGGEYKIVEKSVSKERFSNYFVEAETNLSNREIQKKVGFAVMYPKTLNDCKLSKIYIGTMLQKEVDYKTGMAIWDRALKATHDDKEFQKLKPYKPVRCMDATYMNEDKYITIKASNTDIWLTDSLGKSNYKTVKIGSLKAKWIECTYPIYPKGQQGGDLSQKPSGIRLTHALVFKVYNKSYRIASYEKGKDSSLESTTKTAQAFIRNLTN